MGNKSQKKEDYTEKEYLTELYQIQDAKLHSYEGKTIFAKVVKVYDGDTVHIIFKEEIRKDRSFIKERCRMMHYDSPEIRSKNEKEKEKAIEARDYLKDRILMKVVKVKFGKQDKWGRPLIEIYLEEEHINQTMLDREYGKPYEGGTKE